MQVKQLKQMGGTESVPKSESEYLSAPEIRQLGWFVNFRGAWYFQTADVNTISFEIVGPVTAELYSEMTAEDLSKIGSIMSNGKKYYLCMQMNYQGENKDNNSALDERLKGVFSDVNK